MPVKMTNKAREAARTLAIAYDAFNEARADSRSNGIATWGRMLLEAQEKTGVELSSPDFINFMIAEARKQAA